MFVVAPLKTDAAIDHQPWGTVVLIAANVAVALLLGFPDLALREARETFHGTVEPPFVNSLGFGGDSSIPSPGSRTRSCTPAGST